MMEGKKVKKTKKAGAMETEEKWEYGVDSYQVLVPTGDCSIHFLVQRQSGAEVGKEEKPRIEVAILVDGGKAAKPACKAIIETLKTLKGVYGKSPVWKAKRRLPDFVFWLVTHWDGDHYRGALEYFSKLPKIYSKPTVYASVLVDSDLGPRNLEDRVSWATRELFRS